MANQEHLEILRQGPGVWNKWKRDNFDITQDFSGANLNHADLSGADLASADLSISSLFSADLNCTEFSCAVLKNADLRFADLFEANFNCADLVDANLSFADINSANFSQANLEGAILECANFRNTNLWGANLREANLSGALLVRPVLTEADVTNAIFAFTSFDNCNLSQALGLDSVIHAGPSTIGTDTLLRSNGRIPEVFLRGCGLTDWEIESAKLYNPDLSNEEITDIQYRIHDLRVHQAVQIKPLFISYSHSDTAFVDRIEKHLNQKGIRFWRDIHHATVGRLERQIDRAIRLHPLVLLILSANSVESDWVQHEARLARKLEQETKSDVLCPIALDDAWKTCGWPERLREQIMEYNILDFSNWHDYAHFQKMFSKLLEGLNLFYK